MASAGRCDPHHSRSELGHSHCPGWARGAAGALRGADSPPWDWAPPVTDTGTPAGQGAVQTTFSPASVFFTMRLPSSCLSNKKNNKRGTGTRVYPGRAALQTIEYTWKKHDSIMFLSKEIINMTFSQGEKKITSR